MSYLWKVFMHFMTKFNRINKNTIVVIASDLGLNYGAFSQSFAGLRERMEPILYMKVPKSLEETIRVNRKMYTTPFDLYQTIQGTLNTTKVGSVPVRLSPSPGLSLFSHLPESRSSCERNPDIPNTMNRDLKLRFVFGAELLQVTTKTFQNVPSAMLLLIVAVTAKSATGNKVTTNSRVRPT